MTDLRRCLILGIVISFIASTCERDRTPPWPARSGKLELCLEKSLFDPGDTVVVTFRNGSDEIVFLEGCNPIYLASMQETTWVESPMRLCVWEDVAHKIPSGGSYQEAHPALMFPGLHRFVAPVYMGCVEDKPISEARCEKQQKICSGVFSVIGCENAHGVLRIVPSKTEYRWEPGDLSSSHQIEASVINPTGHEVYAKLGHCCAPGLDQEQLFVAEGGDAWVERFGPDELWHPMPRGLLLEGVTTVALRPHRTYRLLAALVGWQKDETGYFRLKVQYYDLPDPPPGTQAKVDYSVMFTIR